MALPDEGGCIGCTPRHSIKLHTAYNVDNMGRLLGSNASNVDAERFAAHLLARGWDLVEGSDGKMEAWRDGQEMAEEDWLEELAACFEALLE